MVKRKDNLHVVVMSATMDAEKFQSYFDGAPLLDIPGRMFPVEIFFTQKPEKSYFDAAISTTLNIIQYEEPGDILVFLTGEEVTQSSLSNRKLKMLARRSPRSAKRWALK